MFICSCKAVATKLNAQPAFAKATAWQARFAKPITVRSADRLSKEDNLPGCLGRLAACQPSQASCLTSCNAPRQALNAQRRMVKVGTICGDEGRR